MDQLAGVTVNDQQTRVGAARQWLTGYQFRGQFVVEQRQIIDQLGFTHQGAADTRPRGGGGSLCPIIVARPALRPKAATVPTSRSNPC